MLENRPIICIVIGYIIGIIMGLYCKISIVLLYLVLIPISKYLKLKKRQTHKFKLISFNRYFRYVKLIFSSKVLKIIIISSIISNSIIIYQNNKYENIYKSLDKKEIKITGTIISNKKEKENKYVYKLKTNNKMYLYINIKKSVKLNIQYGDKVIIEGIYKGPSGKRNYKGFDYKQYLKTLKISGTVNVKNINIIEKSKTTIFTISNNVFLNIKNNIENNFNEKVANVLLGLTIGYTDNIDEETKENFRDSNISHILAISGMHIGYIVVSLKFILEKTIGKRKGKILTSLIIFIYMFITGFSPSVVRAGIMAIISILAGLFYRKSDTYNNLSLSLLILLVYNPFLINNASLLLSYSGTIGIILLQKNIKSVTFSATLFVIPVIAICFNQVAISSLIISIITGYIVGPIIILGIGFVVLSPILKFLKLIFIQKIYIELLNIMIVILIKISEIGGILPLNKIYVTTPSILKIIIYYSIILIRKFFYINI